MTSSRADLPYTCAVSFLPRTCLRFNIYCVAPEALELQLPDRAVLPVSCCLGSCPSDAENENEGADGTCGSLVLANLSSQPGRSWPTISPTGICRIPPVSNFCLAPKMASNS